MSEQSRSVIVNALSVDVEDYFHVEAFAQYVRAADWDSYESRVRRNTNAVLDIFAEHGCKATFFVLGWVAEREPALIRSIADAGHEIACHSYAHRRINTMSAEQFRSDLQRARSAIEDATGRKVVGFRAPSFSVVERSMWALDVLVEEGFEYDASIFPVHHDLYGVPDAPRFPHLRNVASGGSIAEVPPSTIRISKTNIGVGGGGYLRLLPFAITRWAIRHLNNVEQKPAVVYFHPWEIDPGQPRIQAHLRSRVRHYTGLADMKRKIETLVREFRFEPIADMVDRELRNPSSVHAASA